MNMPRRSERDFSDTSARLGFSLIELLVVILIIGILIAIALVSLRSARETARSVVCLTNLRTLGTATSTYVQTNHDLLPLAIEVVDVRIGRVAPFDVLSQELSISPPGFSGGEVRTHKPFICPSDPDQGRTFGTSYRYVPADFMRIDIWNGRPQFGVTKMYEDGPEDFAIFSDLGRFHGRPDRRESSQMVTYSQAVRRQPSGFP